MAQKVRLAIAGFGLVGRRHGDAMMQVADTELVAVIDPSETGRQLGEQQGATPYSTLEAFLAEGGADGIILATPNALHVEQALACVEQGLPTLVEKPIATQASDAAALVEVARTKGVPLLVGHHRRHNPLIQTAKALIEEGEIGAIRAVQATCWLYKPDSYFETAEWRKQRGAGPISVNLVHDVDLIRYLCGEVSTVRAVASPSARGFENEDVASALLEFESGAVGTITVSDSIVAPWSWELTSKEYPIYPPTRENCYMIGGSHGSLSVPDLRVWHYADGKRDWWAPISSTAKKRATTDPLVNQIKNFAAVIRGEAEPVVTGEEGVRTLAVVEAIQRSAASGEVIHLPKQTEASTLRALENI